MHHTKVDTLRVSVAVVSSIGGLNAAPRWLTACHSGNVTLLKPCQYACKMLSIQRGELWLHPARHSCMIHRRWHADTAA